MRLGNAKSKTPVFCLPLLSPFYIFAFITNENTDIMKLLRIIVAVVTALYFCSCQQNDIRIKQLTNIDSVADNDAERALNMLDSIGPYMKNATKASRNYYELLKIKAQDKAYIPQTSDSTITRLVEYYENKGDKRLLPKAYYYAGRIYRKLHDAPQAVKYFNMAEATAKKYSKDTKLLANIYAQAGYTLRYQEFHKRSLIKFINAYKTDKINNDTCNMVLSLRDIADTYRNLENPYKALEYFNIAKRLASTLDDKSYASSIKDQMASLYLYELKDADKALKLLKESDPYRDSIEISPALSIYSELYRITGKEDSALMCYKKLLKYGNIYGRQGAYDGLTRHCIKSGKNKEAYRYFELYMNISDSIRKLNASDAVAKYLALYDYSIRDEQNKELKLKNQQEKSKTTIFVITSILLATILISTIMLYRKRFEIINLKIEKLKIINSGIKENKAKPTDDKIRKINSSEIYKTIQKKISAYSEKNENLSETEWDELDNVVNSVYENYTEKLHNIYNKMSSFEYRVCLLIKINISPVNISHLTNHSKESISSVRRRLYYKAFNRKGSPADWDEIISSL